MKIILECYINKESAPEFTYGLAKALKNNGVDVYAIIYEEIENYRKWIELLGIDHLYIFCYPLSFRKNPIRSIASLAGVKARVKNVQYDYLIDTFPMGMPRDISKYFMVKEKLCIDHDVIHHSSTSEALRKSTNEKLSLFDSIIILSKTFLPMARIKHQGKAIYVLRHGAMEYPAIEAQVRYENSYDVNYLYFGRIDGYKGLHVLSKAYSALSKDYKNISLTIAGGGDFAEYKDEYAGLLNCTVVNKYLDNAEIAYYFSKPNTVVVLPYLDGTQSGVIGMAFNYRTPVIVSDTGGLKEQLFDGEMGLFAEPGNFQDLQKKMEQFLCSKDLYAEQRKLMEDGFNKSTWDYVVKEFLEELGGDK